MAQPDELFDSEINAITSDDSVYDYHATSLKPAHVIKQQHIEQIQEFLKFRELIEQIGKSHDLLMYYLPGRVSNVEMTRINDEIAGINKHFMKFLLSLEGESSERPILLQEICGFSDETMLDIYSLALDLMNEGNYSVAFTLLVLISALAPHVPSYWIAEGICLQELNRHEEAITLFEGLRLLDPRNPAPYAYSMASYAATQEEEKAKETLKTFKWVMQTYDGPDKEIFEERIKVLAE